MSRRPTAPFSADFSVGLDANRSGEQQGYSARATLGGVHDAWYWQASASWLDRDDWTLPNEFQSAGPPQMNPMLPLGNLEDGGARERSASRDRNASLRIGYAPDARTEVALTVYDQNAEKQVPTYAGPPNANQRFNFFDWPQWDKSGVYAIGKLALNDVVSFRVRVYYDEFQNTLESFDNTTFTTITAPMGFISRYDDHAAGGSIETGWQMSAKHELVGAIHYREDRHKQISDFPARTPPALDFGDRTASIGLEWRYRPTDAWDVRLGASHDSREAQQAQDQNAGGATFALEDQSATNVQLGVVRTIAGGEIYGSLARKSRFPSQFERYSYRLGQALPNPALALERAINYELGFRGEPFVGLRLDVATFLSDLDDLIQPVTVPVSCTATPPSAICLQNRNVGKARYHGAETSLRYLFTDQLEVGVSYTWLDRESRSTPRVVLFGTPDHSGFVFARYRLLERFELVPSVTFASSRRTSDIAPADGEPVGGFTTVDLRAIWNLSPDYRLELTARNVTDKLYYLDYGFPNPGRTYSAIFRAGF